MMDFETTMAMIGDNDPTQYRLDTVPVATRNQIDCALETVFQGFSLQEWLKGGTLGDAWRTALDKMRPIGFDISADSAVVLYLRHANFHHRAAWQHKIIASRNACDFIKCPPDQIEQWRARGVAQVRDGMDQIRNAIDNFVGTPRAVTPRVRPEMTRMHMRENEREMTRERVR